MQSKNAPAINVSTPTVMLILTSYTLTIYTPAVGLRCVTTWTQGFACALLTIHFMDYLPTKILILSKQLLQVESEQQTSLKNYEKNATEFRKTQKITSWSALRN